jgi:transposase-like protein
MQESKPRRHSCEFRIEIAQRMLAGENVMALSKQHQLARSQMYRWRDIYRREGPAGLSRFQGRSPGGGPAKPVASDTEQRLRQQIAELERKVGQQAVEIDFFKGVFKRLESLPKAPPRSGKASSPRSEE